MSPNARWPAKPMNLNATGCKVCSHRGSKVGQEKLARRYHQRYANSLWTSTLNYLPCPGEKLPRCVTFVTAEGQIIRVSNTLPPLVLHPPSKPDDTNPGTRFLTRQTANWQPYDCMQKDGRSLLLPPTCNAHVTLS